MVLHVLTLSLPTRRSSDLTDRDIRRLYSAIALPLGKSTRLNVCQPRCCGKTCRPSPSQRSGRTGPPNPHDGGSPAWVLPSRSGRQQIGRAHVRTPVTNAHIVCRLLLEQKKHNRRSN